MDINDELMERLYVASVDHCKILREAAHNIKSLNAQYKRLREVCFDLLELAEELDVNQGVEPYVEAKEITIARTALGKVKLQ